MAQEVTRDFTCWSFAIRKYWIQTKMKDAAELGGLTKKLLGTGPPLMWQNLLTGEFKISKVIDTHLLKVGAHEIQLAVRLL